MTLRIAIFKQLYREKIYVAGVRVFARRPTPPHPLRRLAEHGWIKQCYLLVKSSVLICVHLSREHNFAVQQPTMYANFLKTLLIVVLLTACSGPKNIGKTDTQTLDNLKAHVYYLADDKLEGRRTGTKGEELAMDYIINQFKTIGLIPKGTESYPQSFPVNDGKQIDSVTEFIINGNKLAVGKDFFPFPFSPAQNIEALPAITLQEVGMPWFYDLKETLEENKNNPHFDLPDYIQTSSRKAKDRGASAVIFYNTSSIDDKLVFDGKDRSEQLTIPVIYVSKGPAQKYFSNKVAALNMKLRTSISEKNRVGHNVIGYIDNKAATT